MRLMSNTGPPIPLQSKVSLALLLLISAFVLFSYTILRSVIAPAFAELEMAAARSDLRRAEAAIRADIENLEAITADWAPWDDIYYYVSGQNPSFRKSNLDRPTLTNLNLDMMAVYATHSRFVWGQVLEDGAEVPIDSLDILDPDHPSSEGLTAHRAALDRTAGFVNTRLGPMIISSRPILRSDDSGPVAGALVMGQRLDRSHLDRFRERTDVDMAWDPADTDLDADVRPVFETSDRFVSGSKTLLDIQGRPILVLRTATPRRISGLGAQTINAATLFLMTAGVLTCGFIWFMLRHIIVRPIERLTTHIDDIRKSGDLSRQIDMRRGDEIGALAAQFDSMTADVCDARQALLDQSFKAGKADTAAEVMHNIRNAMTPMINGLERLRKSFKVTENLRIAEAGEQLASDECAPERKRKFLEYIDASFKHIESVGNDAQTELNVVTSQAKQIEGILSDQEKFANVAPVAENLFIDEVLDEAANVLPREKPRTVELAVDRDAERLRVRAHRIGLLQVLGNLILNAYESIKRSGVANGHIFVAAADEVVDEQQMVRVTIRDNGGGFDGETKARIFQRGFTSKARAETNGLGLHWCANAVASMGGKISAESPGQGRGAVFHVLLPAAERR